MLKSYVPAWEMNGGGWIKRPLIVKQYWLLVNSQLCKCRFRGIFLFLLSVTLIHLAEILYLQCGAKVGIFGDNTKRKGRKCPSQIFF